MEMSSQLRDRYGRFTTSLDTKPSGRKGKIEKLMGIERGSSTLLTVSIAAPWTRDDTGSGGD
jgi:hypothetical protein